MGHCGCHASSVRRLESHLIASEASSELQQRMDCWQHRIPRASKSHSELAQGSGGLPQHSGLSHAVKSLHNAKSAAVTRFKARQQQHVTQSSSQHHLRAFQTSFLPPLSISSPLHLHLSPSLSPNHWPKPSSPNPQNTNPSFLSIRAAGHSKALPRPRPKPKVGRGAPETRTV